MAKDLYIPLSDLDTDPLSQKDLFVAINRTVQIFSKIVGRPLWVSSVANDLRTDGDTLYLDLDSSAAYLHAEHLLAFILFETNTSLRKAFVAEYLHQLKEVELTEGVMTPHESAALLLDYIIGVLDAYRVDNLWGKIYAGSGARLKRASRLKTETFASRAHQSVEVFITCAVHEVEMNQGLFSVYLPSVLKCRDLCKEASFDAVLVASKKLIQEMVHLLTLKQNPNSDLSTKDRARALNKLVQQTGRVPETMLAMNKERDVSDFDDYSQERSKVLRALQMPSDQIEAFCREDARVVSEELDQIVGQLAQSMSTKTALRTGLDAKVVFEKPEVTERIKVLTEKDEQELVRLRNLFVRLLGKRRWSLEDSGTEVDIEAVIRTKAQKGADSPVFRTPFLGKGFSALLLIDFSASMEGSRILQVQKGAELLRRALDFPFVNLRILGFSNPEPTRVSIVDFGKGEGVATREFLSVGGETPLHIAIEVGRKMLCEDEGRKLLFVLTDGRPIFSSQSLSENTRSLEEQVRQALVQAVAQGIQSTVFLIGNHQGQQVAYDINEAARKKMFGPPVQLSLVLPDEVSASIVKTVLTHFQLFLRSA